MVYFFIVDRGFMSQTFELKPEYKQKAIRSYVIRGGRITEAQKKAFDNAWAGYGLSLFDGRIDPAIVFGRQAPLVLEVGFGMGDSLLQMAIAAPETDFIGIEVHPPGVGRLINNAAKEGLTNIRVYMADAIDVLEDCIPDNSLTRFQLFFPDPWHKKKHNKRRIVQQSLMKLINQKLLVDGICHFATDWQPYADYMMEEMSLADSFRNSEDEYFFSTKPAYRPLTKFENRGQLLGHGVWDLLFIKTEQRARDS
jgi:tRNA (guanine-N7-)-methyltransferase